MTAVRIDYTMKRKPTQGNAQKARSDDSFAWQEGADKEEISPILGNHGNRTQIQEIEDDPTNLFRYLQRS